MNKYRTAETSPSRPVVVTNHKDNIVQPVLPQEALMTALERQPHRSVVGR